MGCSASRLDAEQCVSRCKDRKHFIKLAVQYRHAFAAAHAAYIQSLKNTGAAIRQFGEGEAKDNFITESAPSQIPDPLYLPPPLPHFLTSSAPHTPPKLGRASSMPPMRKPAASPTSAVPLRSPSSTLPPAVKEEDEEGGDEEGQHKEEVDVQVLSPSGKGSYMLAEAKPPPSLPAESHTPPPPPPPTGSPWEIFNVFPSSANEDLDVKLAGLNQDEQLGGRHEETSVLKVKDELAKGSAIKDCSNSNLDTVTPDKERGHGVGKSFMLLLKELDDQFLTAFESGQEVARLLEARKMHYNSNFADAIGNWNHSSRVLRVMSWERPSNIAIGDGVPFDIYEGREKETHASTLDKLLAWEKKLHEEVKAGEMVRLELERKSVQLRNRRRREENSASLNKTEAIVKTLQTRYLVEIQAVDAASMEVEKLRDDCLHMQMAMLVQELMNMWKIMANCHKHQHQMIEDIASVGSSVAANSTTDFHRKNTMQLETEVNLWRQNFDRLIVTQKEYLNAVYCWLRLHIIQIESDGKDVPGSPQLMSMPPLFNLCKAWLNALDQLPYNLPLHALKTFSDILHDLSVQQLEELKQKRKVEAAKKELERKEQAMRVHEIRYRERHAVSHDNMKENTAVQESNPLKETMKLLMEKVEAETEKYQMMCLKSGTMTISSLQTGLPPVLHAMKEFTRVCSQCFADLYTLNLNNGMPKLQIGY